MSTESTVFINGRFLSQRMTGIQRYAWETLRALDRLIDQGEGPAGRKIVVLAPPNARAPELRAIEFRRVGNLTGNGWEQVSLPLASQGSLLFSFGATGPALKKDQVVTIHDAAICAVPQAFSWKFRSWYKLLLPLLVRRTPFVMTVSEFSKSELILHFGAEPGRVHVSPGGWEHALRATSTRDILERHQLRPRQYVLAVSSISPHKNFKLVADAVRKLDGLECDVVVAGAIDDRIFGTSAANALRGLKLVGYVDDGQLRALYENAAAFIYPSIYEGFGLPPLEAMALGCPVLASNAAAIPEVCGNGAWYFSPDDAEGLARLIEQVIKDPHAQESLAALGRLELGRYGWDRTARRHLDMITELTNASPYLDGARDGEGVTAGTATGG